MWGKTFNHIILDYKNASYCDLQFDGNDISTQVSLVVVAPVAAMVQPHCPQETLLPNPTQYERLSGNA